MSDIAHVHGWPRTRSAFVLAVGAVLVGSVLFSAVLLLVGAVPAWGGARAQRPGTDAVDRQSAGTVRDADPDEPAAGGSSGREDDTESAPTSSRNRPGRTRTDPPASTAPATQPPTTQVPPTATPTRPPTSDPHPAVLTSAPSTADPPSAPAPPSSAPAGHRARPAAVPQPPGPVGGFAPDRVPDVGSRPSVDSAPSATSSATEVAAGRASFLPGKDMGVKIFAAGLVALIVSFGGLVTLALRRRQ